MNTKVIGAVTVAIVILIAGILFVQNQSKTNTPPTATTSEIKTGESKAGDSRYVEYSKATLDQAAGARRVLYFYASWCPTCRPADANFKEQASKIPEDVTLIRVNYNDTETDEEEKALANKYGITYQHTFVQIDGQGNEVTKWNGGQLDELLTQIR